MNTKFFSLRPITPVAKSLETLHVEGDVVICTKNVACPATVSVLDVGQNTVDREQPERGAVHLADAAEIAEMQATTRRFDNVGFPEVHVKTRCQPFVAGGQTDLRQIGERTAWVVDKPISIPIGQA